MNNHFLDKNNIPKHVAIIMDGNGRWAKQKGEMRIFGHTNGVESVRESLTAAAEIGVKYLTLYAFSTENWNRPKEEVAALMDLLVKAIYDEVEELNEKGVRLETIGNTSILAFSWGPAPAQDQPGLADYSPQNLAETKINIRILSLS